MAFVIGEPCIDVMDRSCMEECPVDCIYEGNRMLYIHPVECIDCGACQDACPMEAIVPDRRMPDTWAPFRDAARGVFTDQGLGGGASAVGTVRDPEVVVAWVRDA
ncbi:ferredoxin [Pseudonocardia sp. N23]|uniref:ferredoxin n=1 Tax=Pseudonocardia sp. N23 TaxID=1987376 RepID=UPI000BFD7377|nr:ferredoxin [Pseudonocardia sp. N23]GAY08688.1 4Fe-4S ferredoxin, iron-sulfur binding [Pseudonocardia sp. N23]